MAKAEALYLSALWKLQGDSEPSKDQLTGMLLKLARLLCRVILHVGETPQGASHFGLEKQVDSFTGDTLVYQQDIRVTPNLKRADRRISIKASRFN